MIFIDRSRVQTPKGLLSDRVKKGRADAQVFFTKAPAQRLQQRFEFDSRIWMDARPALGILFRDKCAFCESLINLTSTVIVDHFRPRVAAVGQQLPSGRPGVPPAEEMLDGYWWLAYEWENLYSICSLCNSNKRNIFPVDGSRAIPGAVGPDLRKERAFLLDPCYDKPEAFFQFDENGSMAPIPNLAGFELNRAQATIQILGLNRAALVHARAMAAKDLVQVLESAEFSHPLISAQHVKDVIGPMQSYLATRRAAFRSWIEKTKQRLSPELQVRLMQNAEKYISLFDSLWTSEERAAANLDFTVPSDAILRAAQPEPTGKAASARNVAKGKKTSSTPKKTPPAFLLGRGGYIEWIEISNFKAIEHVKISLPESGSDHMSWKVLLGENGVGKSTVLQAVSLALLGEHAAKDLLNPPKILRRLQGRDKFAKEGFVRVQLSKSSAPVELRFTQKTHTYSFGSALPLDLMFKAYGATRLMPRTKTAAVSKRLPVNSAANLFNPFLPVCDANAWLASLKDKKSFASAALSLKDLLRIPTRTWLHRDKNNVIVPLNGVKISLNELSAGYESILVLAVDIMSALHGTVHDMRNAAGIVLLDEIDAHLHPRWKMEIVPAMRRCFPNIQFLVTTHEPLCLRGLDDREIALMRREAHNIILEDDLPSPKGLRVDQLLTSPLFGLHSTIEPELDAKFTEYYALLAKPEDELLPKERERRIALRSELSQYSVLGHTRRDQMVYEAVDEYLAKERHQPSPERRRELRTETKQRIAAILADIDSTGGVS